MRVAVWGQSRDVDADGGGGRFGYIVLLCLLHGIVGSVCSAIGMGPSAVSSVVSSGTDVQSKLFVRALWFVEERGVLIVNMFQAVGCLEDHCHWEW